MMIRVEDIWKDRETLAMIKTILRESRLALGVALKRQFFLGVYALKPDGSFDVIEVVAPAVTLRAIQERWCNQEDWCRSCLNQTTQHDWKCPVSPWADFITCSDDTRRDATNGPATAQSAHNLPRK